MNKKIVRFLFVLLSVVVLISCCSVTAYAKETAKTEKTETTTAAGQDLFDVAENIIRDVYTQIAGISTILAGLMSAIAVIGAKMSNTQQRSDQAWDWLKRIWIAWAIINGIGAFISYITPFFAGYNVLP